MDRVKVLYLLGTTRCGSTLISSLLTQVPGLVHVGELCRIWEEGYRADYACGCGAVFSQCPFWKAVVAGAFSDGGINPGAMTEVADAWIRSRSAPLLLSDRGRRFLDERARPHTDAMVRLYRSIAKHSASEVVVDSSKSPMFAWLLAGRPDVELSVLHVVRDARAVAHSWQRTKFDPSKGQDMARISPARTALKWLGWNSLGDTLEHRPGSDLRYLQMRYEDFAGDPVGHLNKILSWIGSTAPVEQLLDAEQRFTNVQSHTIAGNPMRFSTGRLKIKPDTAWRADGGSRDNTLVTALTWPLLWRYGYTVR